MLKIIAIISLVVSVASAAAQKVMDIFGMSEDDIGSVIVSKENYEDD